MKIGVVGAGAVGATAAYALVMRGVGSEIVLVDKAEKRAQAGLIKRVGQVEDVAGLVLFLASDDSDFRSRIIRNNKFIDGAFGIYMRRNQSNLNYPTGTKIENNNFLKQEEINTYYISIY